ncbi:O-methyltransferase [Ilyonectria robusta]|uniref:O-methyltransferase n=1 Tax=Ilyonectria robusta TaxID=1079257 RepID=UPI001E8EDDBB|nr:O-methyltransferase [Ilyonectria robusta]KAH8685251.1 O-methyltransferase [Ilyonectria robusta]
MLVAAKILRQLGDDHLAHTPKSLVYANSSPHGFLAQMSFDETLKSCAFLPDYFDKYPGEPQGPVGCPYSFAEGHPEKSCWDVMNQDSERMRVFMQAMKTIESQMPATGMYDFDWVKGELAKQTERMLFVDVGGSKGHSLQAVCEANSWLPRERCMLQDRDEVIEEVKLSDSPGLRGVKMMGHDFNLEQPVKGALIYHLRRCLHDYGDEIGIKIIRNIAGAMSPDSRLLIVEQVVAVPPSPMDTHFDFLMLTFGGKERNAKQFENMVKEAGLKILKVHKKPNTPISVMECAKE